MSPAAVARRPAPGRPRRRMARMGPRLRALLELCPREGPVADVGSGHGRLALELKRRSPEADVYATEEGTGPARELRRLLSPGSGVAILEGPGLRPLAGLGCRGVVLAGMGGNTIVGLLRAEPELARSLAWACLQPAQREERLEAWLRAEGWTLGQRRAVLERGRLYRLYLVAPA